MYGVVYHGGNKAVSINNSKTAPEESIVFSVRCVAKSNVLGMRDEVKEKKIMINQSAALRTDRTTRFEANVMML